MAFYSYLSTKIIIAFITKSYQDLFGVRSYINALNIIDLEDFPSLNDAVLSLHSCYTIMIDKYSYSKIVENQNGETYFYRDPCNN